LKSLKLLAWVKHDGSIIPLLSGDCCTLVATTSTAACFSRFDNEVRGTKLVEQANVQKLLEETINGQNIRISELQKQLNG